MSRLQKALHEHGYLTGRQASRGWHWLSRQDDHPPSASSEVSSKFSRPTGSLGWSGSRGAIPVRGVDALDFEAYECKPARTYRTVFSICSIDVVVML